MDYPWIIHAQWGCRKGCKGCWLLGLLQGLLLGLLL
jgi:hypothetical protein